MSEIKNKNLNIFILFITFDILNNILFTPASSIHVES